MKFISPDWNHRYLCKLANSLDIKFTRDYKEIEESDRAFIVWNKYGYLAYPQKKYIDKYEYIKKLEEENKPYYIVERGALPDSIFVDKGFLCESKSYNKAKWNVDLTDIQRNQVKEYIKNFISNEDSLERQGSSFIDSNEFYSHLNIDPANYKKIVFVPLQMFTDTVTLLWCDWIKNVGNFQILIAELAKENPDILFLIKNHPNEQIKSRAMDQYCDNIRIVDNFHYKNCIDYSDVVLTINSGIGLQSMMWEKPTIVVGKAFYKFKGLNYKANSKKEVLDLIYNAKPPVKKLMENFIYYLKFVFYTTCIMENLGNNCSEPKRIDKITYEDPNGKRINIEKEVKQDNQRIIFFELLKLIPDLCVLKDTCLECIRSCELIDNKENLYIASNHSIDSILQKNGYKLIDNNKFEKFGINIFIEEYPDNVKQMTLWSSNVNVPMPVVLYLNKIYGFDWKIKNVEKPTIIEIKENLNIVYTFNNYGWIFEFEANYYKKYSNHNIIPIHQKELPNMINKNIDCMVIPSAWHWERDLDLNNRAFINEFKKKGVKFVCQHNSHIEEQFCTPTADLIMPSSKKIYDVLKNKYNYTKMIWFPHFVDTDLFVPKNQWNNFTVGFAGNFKNRFKRPHIIEKLEKDFNINKKCDYHGFLEPNRDHSDMVNFYNTIDIYISPSISEGTPMTMLEAMSCGKLVFLTDTGISNYMLDKFFIIPNTNDEEIYNEFKLRLNQLKNYSKEKILDLGERNRKRVKKLDWKKNVHHLDNIYKALCSNNLDKCTEISHKFVDNLK